MLLNCALPWYHSQGFLLLPGEKKIGEGKRRGADETFFSMRGQNTAATADAAARSSEEASKRKTMKYKDSYKEGDKYKIIISAERSSIFRFHTLKFALFVITCCTVLSLFYSPIEQQIEIQQSFARSRLVDAGWIRQKTLSDPRYVSRSIVDWHHIPNLLSSSSLPRRKLNIGLLNFNESEGLQWQNTLPDSDLRLLRLDYADSSITWETLYPEWIDEEEETEVPACPVLPDPQFDPRTLLDLIAVKLPCRNSGSWSRDVARLHLQLSAAKLASVAGAGASSPAHVLFITDCFPLPNLFSCRDVVGRSGNAWLYKANPPALKQKLRLPIGSCELAVPLKAPARPQDAAGAREAYATILHSAEIYVCGAIAAARSIRLTGSTRDLVILVDESISDHHRGGLEAAGWKVRTIRRIRNPKAEKNAYNEWNYSKFRLWQLTEYEKVIFIDADLLILRNIDFLFSMPEISATGNNATIFNSGVMVVEPCNCTFRLLMDHIEEITSYNGGDQGYLNEIFAWWHRIPKQMNFLKHFWEGDTAAERAKKSRLFAAVTPGEGLYVLHYLGLKPWLCFRDFDCNWNSVLYRSFASDEAHATWWRVHDSMPESLHRFCLLPTVIKAGLEHNRRKAELAALPDEHWKRNVTDPRRDICFERFCNWELVLQNWGKPASAAEEGQNTTTPPAAIPSA